mgnify:CR=1 FL=1
MLWWWKDLPPDYQYGLVASLYSNGNITLGDALRLLEVLYQYDGGHFDPGVGREAEVSFVLPRIA